jgi:hypothetical protein
MVKNFHSYCSAQFHSGALSMSIGIILLTLMRDKIDEKFGCTVNGSRAFNIYRVFSYNFFT